jgi:hypothetical protein
MEPKAQSAFNENFGKQPKKVKFNRKKKFSIGNINLQEHDIFDSKKNGSKIEKINYTNIMDFEKYKNAKGLEESNTIDNVEQPEDKILKNLYSRPIHHKYYLSVREVKNHEHKVGYIFRFELPNQKNLETKVSSTKKIDLALLNRDNQDLEKSDLSVVSFAGVGNEKKNSNFPPSPDNPFGINPEGGDDFFKKINVEKENQFTLDLNDMSYKQLGLNKSDNRLFEKLKKEAIEKINMTNQQLKSNEQEEEESSSSSQSYYSDEDENSIDS